MDDSNECGVSIERKTSVLKPRFPFNQDFVRSQALVNEGLIGVSS